MHGNLLLHMQDLIIKNEMFNDCASDRQVGQLVLEYSNDTKGYL